MIVDIVPRFTFRELLNIRVDIVNKDYNNNEDLVEDKGINVIFRLL